MKAFVFKPSNQYVGQFQVRDAKDVPSNLEMFLASHKSVPSNSYVECCGKRWTIVQLEPLIWCEEDTLPQGGSDSKMLEGEIDGSALEVGKVAEATFISSQLPKLPGWFSVVFIFDLIGSLVYYAPFSFKALSVSGQDLKSLVMRCMRPTALTDNLEHAHIYNWNMIETTQITKLFQTLALGHFLLFALVIIANIGLLRRRSAGITTGWIAVAVAFILCLTKLFSPFYFDGLGLLIGLPFNLVYVCVLLRTSRLARDDQESIPLAIVA